MTSLFRRCVAPALAALLLTACGGGGGGSGSSSDPSVKPEVTITFSNGAGVNGSIVITLENQLAPVTVANFLAYVKTGFYVGTAIHRLVPGFIVQGGGYAATLTPNGAFPTLKTVAPPIVLEDNAGLLNKKYTIAMARTGVPDSATSQFFFNLADNTNLDRTSTSRGYAVFGTVTSGTAVIDAMTTAPCSSWLAFFGSGDVGACLPSPNIVIISATQTR